MELSVFNLDSKFSEFDSENELKVVSMREYQSKWHKTMKYLSELVGTETTIRGKAVKCRKNGDLIVEFEDVKCILERDNFTTIYEADGHVHKNKCQQKVGSDIVARVAKVEDGQVYLDRKSVIKELREKYVKDLKTDMCVSGIVTAIDERIGVFVDIGADYSAIIPKKYVEHVFISSLSDYIKVGQKVSAVIVDITYNNNNTEIKDIILNRTMTLPSYEELVSDYENGDIVLATITEIEPPNVYAQLTEHLVVRSFVEPNIKDLKIGQKIKVKIKVDIKKKIITGNIIGVL